MNAPKALCLAAASVALAPGQLAPKTLLPLLGKSDAQVRSMLGAPKETYKDTSSPRRICWSYAKPKVALGMGVDGKRCEEVTGNYERILSMDDLFKEFGLKRAEWKAAGTWKPYGSQPWTKFRKGRYSFAVRFDKGDVSYTTYRFWEN